MEPGGELLQAAALPLLAGPGRAAHDACGGLVALAVEETQLQGEAFGGVQAGERLRDLGSGRAARCRERIVVGSGSLVFAEGEGRSEIAALRPGVAGAHLGRELEEPAFDVVVGSGEFFEGSGEGVLNQIGARRRGRGRASGR